MNITAPPVYLEAHPCVEYEAKKDWEEDELKVGSAICMVDPRYYRVNLVGYLLVCYFMLFFVLACGWFYYNRVIKPKVRKRRKRKKDERRAKGLLPAEEKPVDAAELKQSYDRQESRESGETLVEDADDCVEDDEREECNHERVRY